jgi:hypothetical protein
MGMDFSNPGPKGAADVTSSEISICASASALPGKKTSGVGIIGMHVFCTAVNIDDG